MKEFLANMFFCSNQIKLWHLQTTSYAAHQALGELYDFSTDFTDGFAETYMMSGPKLKAPVITKKFEDFADNQQVIKYIDMVDGYVGVLKKELVGRTDLVNMLDEFRAKLNKTKYLLTLS
jgi:hypothetical protein